MKFLKFFLLLSATTVVIVAAPFRDDDDDNKRSNIQSEFTLFDNQERVSHFLAQQNLIANLTCNKFPRICRLKRSPGPDCCKKKCVNVKTDRLNCGMCGYKCKYTEICCKGNCVNSSFDKRNCGGCNKKCKREEFCVYGMCNYA